MTVAGLTEAFSDSDLLYRVDLVDRHEIDDDWREIVAREHVTLSE
jgi:hypothetical protein